MTTTDAIFAAKQRFDRRIWRGHPREWRTVITLTKLLHEKNKWTAKPRNA